MDRKVLVNVLSQMKNVVGNNQLVPEYHDFQFDGDHVQATNGSLLMDIHLPFDTGLHCAVPVKFLTLLSGVSGDIISVEATEKKVTIKSNRVLGTFEVRPSCFEIVAESDVSEDLEDLQKLNHISELVDGLVVVSFGTSPDKASGTYQGVRIKDSRLYSTDRYRVVKWELGFPTGLDVIITTSFIQLLKKHKDSLVYLGPGTNKTFIAKTKEGMTIVSSVIPGKFPELDQYFEVGADSIQVTFGKALWPTIERHVQVLEPIDLYERITKIEIRDGGAILTSEMPQHSEVTEDIDIIEEINVRLTFWLNPTFLKEIVGFCKGFFFYPDSGLILFVSDKLTYLMRTADFEKIGDTGEK